MMTRATAASNTVRREAKPASVPAAPAPALSDAAAQILVYANSAARAAGHMRLIAQRQRNSALAARSALVSARQRDPRGTRGLQARLQADADKLDAAARANLAEAARQDTEATRLRTEAAKV